MRPAPMLALPLKGTPRKGWVYEQKFDGVRALISKQGNEVSIYTRTFHELVDKVPHLKAIFIQQPFDFILDGEIVSEVGGYKMFDKHIFETSFSRAQGILGSDVSKAIRDQRSLPLQFMAFDCLAAPDTQGNMTSLFNVPEAARRNILELLYKQIWQTNRDRNSFLLAQRWNSDIDAVALFDAVKYMNGEGLMVKNPMGIYQPGKRPANTWYKLKVIDSADVVIMGYKPGQGKFRNMVGAIEFGQMKDGKLIPRSRCSGMTDAERIDFTRNGEKYIGQVMEISYFGRVGPERSFRHPNFVRVRDDKLAGECVWD